MQASSESLRVEGPAAPQRVDAGSLLGNRVFSNETNDAWLHSTSATRWTHLYQQLFPEPFLARHTEVSLGDLQIVRETLNGSIAYSGHAWSGSQAFMSLLPRSGEIYFRGRPLIGNGIATFAWDAVERVTTAPHLDAVYVIMDQKLMDDIAREVCGRPAVFGRQAQPLLFSEDPSITLHFQEEVARIITDAYAFPSMVDNERGRALLRQRVVDVMAQVLLAPWETARPLPRPSTRAYVVARSMEFMEANIADPIGLVDVCRAVRVCPRTLRYSFESVLGVSPSRYLLATRLNRVHSELASGSHEAIQSIAARWGFWHMGRFAQYYRAMFRERPSETTRIGTERRRQKLFLTETPHQRGFA